MAEKTSLEMSDTPYSLTDKYQHYLDTIDKDRIASPPKRVSKVAIVGGGMAGLYCALKLKQKSKTVKLFEANKEVGGRIYTHPFSDEPYQYFEAGATRFPEEPNIITDLIDELNLDLKCPDTQLKLIPYVSSCPLGNRVYVNGTRVEHPCGKSEIMTVEYAETHLNDLGFPKEGGAQWLSKKAEKLLHDVLDPVVKDLYGDERKELNQEALKMYDPMSLRHYLLQNEGWSEQKIDYVEVMLSQTNAFQTGLVDYAISWSENQEVKNWKTIEGGMSRLPKAMARAIGEENIVCEATVVSIDDEGKVGYTKPGRHDEITYPSDFDAIILALPPSAIRMIPHRPRWPPGFERCLRSINFKPVFKMGLHFKTRFWESEDLDKGPSKGGESLTDLPCRVVMYPSYGLGDKGMGVLVVMCGMNDSSHWLPKSKEEKIKIALENLQELYPEVDIAKQYAGGCPNDCSYLNEAFPVEWAVQWPLGDAAFYPGQFTAMYNKMDKRRGNIYFAGEHLSIYHSNILGAIDSAKKTLQKLK